MRCSIAILTLSVIAANLLAQVIPSWWSSRNVFESGTSADDFVAVNQGQLKNFARAAFEELQAKAPGGAGEDLIQMMNSWDQSWRPTDDFVVVTVGQVKDIVERFVSRLDEIRQAMVPNWGATATPWPVGVRTSGDLDVANAGQVKQAFQGLEGTGHANALQSGLTGDLNQYRMGMSWLADTDEDNYSDLTELIEGSDPNDAMDKPSWTLRFLNADNPTLMPNSVVSLTLEARSAGSPVEGAQIDFKSMALMSDAEGGPPTRYLTSYTGGDGKVSLNLHVPKTSGVYTVNASPLVQPLTTTAFAFRVPLTGGPNDPNDPNNPNNPNNPSYSDWRRGPNLNSGPWALDFAPDDDFDGVLNHRDAVSNDRVFIHPHVPETFIISKFNHSQLENWSKAKIGANGAFVWGTDANTWKRWIYGQTGIANGVGGIWDVSKEGDLLSWGEQGAKVVRPNGAELYITDECSLDGEFTQFRQDSVGGAGAVGFGPGGKIYGQVTYVKNFHQDGAYAQRTLLGIASRPIHGNALWTIHDGVVSDWSSADSGNYIFNSLVWTQGTEFSKMTYFNTEQTTNGETETLDAFYEVDGFTYRNNQIPQLLGGRYRWHTVSRGWGLPINLQTPRGVTHYYRTRERAFPFISVDAFSTKGSALGRGVNQSSNEADLLWLNGQAKTLLQWLEAQKQRTAWVSEYEIQIPQDIRPITLAENGIVIAAHDRTIVPVDSEEQKVHEKLMALIPFAIEPKAMLENGQIEKVTTPIQTSLPCPEFESSTAQVLTTRYDAQGQILADIQFSGTLKSRVCDSIKGDKGTITSIRAFANEEDLGEDDGEIVVASEKDDGTMGTRAKPFPYEGTFDQILTNVPLTEGTNLIRLEAMDKIYGIPGTVTWVVKVTRVDTDVLAGLVSPTIALEIDLGPASNLTALTQLSATGQLGALEWQNQVFTRAASGTGHRFVAVVAGQTVVLELSSTEANGVPVIEAQMSVSSSASDSFTVLLSQSDVQAGPFSGGSQVFPVAAAGGGASQIIVDSPVIVEKSTGGEFYPYVFTVNLPEGLPDHSKFQVEMGGEMYGVKKDTVSEQWVLYPSAAASELNPMLISTGPRLPKLNSEGEFEVDSTPLPSTEEDQLMESLQREGFVTGFAKGMAAGGLDMVTGTGAVIAGSMKYVGRGLLTFGCQIRFIGELLTGQDTNATMNMMLEISAPNAEVHDKIHTIAKGLVPVAQWMLSNAENLHALQIAMLTGNFQGIDSAFMRSSELNGALFSMGAEVIAGALEEYQNDPPGVKGYKVGRVVFEVLAVLLPISKAGKLAQLHKSELLTKVLNANVLPQRLVPKMNLLKAGLSTTKMCFVASTLVLCQVEGAARLEPIGGLESLAGAHPELKVWARDEFMGEEGWKRPIAWFTTHPEELFTLGVDSDGDGETDEELTGTGEHPFWVEDHRAFVPMRDLRPGMRLALAQKGKAAIVTGNVSKRGPPGETFTTYNFEVEEFHTYFVGEAGVWVHNSGQAPCELARAAMETLRAQSGDSWIAMREALSRFSFADLSSRTRLKLFNETRQEVLAGRWPGGTAPWENLQSQLRGLGPIGSPSYQDQINGLAGNSTLLGDNLKKIGVEAPWGGSGSGTLAAHHIVAGGEQFQSAIQARKILADAGIDINEAANGVFLPRNAADIDLGKAIHSGRHPEANSDAILARLAPHAGNAAALRRELAVIADHLVNVGWLH
jgi:hypothetical protein